MRSSAVGGAVLGMAMVLSGDVLACGDKLVIVGRGLRPRGKAVSPASILVFARPGGSLPAALGEGGLQKDLERAGHRLRRVETEEDLKKALGAGGFDLILADLAAAPRVEAEAGRAPAHPTVVPALYKPTPEELAEAEREFACVVRSPGKQRDSLAAVDEAMAARKRQAKAPKAP